MPGPVDRVAAPDPSAPQDAREDASAMAAAATTGRSVLAGGFWSAFALLLPQILVLVVSAAAARFLGPTLMGRQSFISFVQITVTGLVTVGLPISLMRTIANAVGEGRIAQTRGLLTWAWRLISVFAVLGGLVVASGALLSDRDQVSWLLAGAAASAAVLQTVPSAVLIGLQRWRQASLAGLVTGVVSSVLVVVVLAEGGGIREIFLIEAVVLFVNLLWTGSLAHRALQQLAPEAEPPGELRRQTLAFARPNALLALLDLVVYRRSEFFFLARYSPSAEIAQYSIAFAAVNALAQLPQAMSNMSSSFATLHGAGEQERMRSGFSRGCRLLLVVSLTLVAGMAALGPALIDVVYGSEYERATHLVLVLLLVFPLLPLATLSDALLVGRAEMRVPLIAVSAAVVVNLTLASLLVPAHGAMGAAIANVSGQVVATVPVAVHAFRVVQVRYRDLHPAYLLRTVVVCLEAAVLGRVLSDLVGGLLGLLAGGVGFVLAFAFVARVLRILDHEDGEWLGHTLGDRLGTRGRGLVLAVAGRQP